MININNECVLVDSREVEKRIQNLRRELEERIIKHKREVKILTDLGNDYLKIPGELADWVAGVTLVRDSFFEQHTKAIAANQMVTANQAITAGQANLNSWPLKFINWKLATKALKKSYAPIDYDGVSYWIKKPD